MVRALAASGPVSGIAFSGFGIGSDGDVWIMPGPGSDSMSTIGATIGILSMVGVTSIGRGKVSGFAIGLGLIGTIEISPIVGMMGGTIPVASAQIKTTCRPATSV